ncbi:hypothetical protein [Novosphingobium sp. ST904]|uniref:hypothetical protein n=1 Tax=Novosphingobium sp. ST904 TaxID=1684385 RepID=UPI0006CDA34F|nr:hypothetical protein [Novosphingobium sp. ST904]KPH59168.1 hypothetical protein ADT71_23780 [Novosphingobium sp. ST904]TCM37747.1 hypothetical protein EDF59_110143 [Novosphingobium sp. ST904]
MTAAIVPFPASSADRLASANIIPMPAMPPRAVLRPIANARREYSFGEVSRLLSLAGEPRTQIGYLRDLAKQCGMPLPKNPRRYRGHLQAGPSMIGSKSRWCALEFDAWLDGQRTPPPGVGIAPSQGAAVGERPLPAAAPTRTNLLNRARLLAAGGR